MQPKQMRDIVADFWQTAGSVKGVMHCWAGTPLETQWFLDLGFHISFSGVVTFKNAKTNSRLRPNGTSRSTVD